MPDNTHHTDNRFQLYTKPHPYYRFIHPDSYRGIPNGSYGAWDEFTGKDRQTYTGSLQNWRVVSNIVFVISLSFSCCKHGHCDNRTNSAWVTSNSFSTPLARIVVQITTSFLWGLSTIHACKHHHSGTKLGNECSQLRQPLSTRVPK